MKAVEGQMTRLQAQLVGHGSYSTRFCAHHCYTVPTSQLSSDSYQPGLEATTQQLYIPKSNNANCITFTVWGPRC